MGVATKSPTQTAAPTPDQMAKSRRTNNEQFLRVAMQKDSVMTPANGSGTTQTYVSATTLPYDVPRGNGAYLEEILVECALTVNPATGTGATYALNAGAPFSLFDRIIVDYNGNQVQARPLLFKWLEQLQGYTRAAPEQSVAGQTVSFIGNTVWGSPFAITTGTANPWNFWFRVPLRRLPRRPAGMLPIMADSTPTQVRCILAQNGQGFDPILNAVANTGGTGASVTVGGTIKLLSKYRDGTSLVQTQPLALDLTGEPTVQYYMDRQISPLVAGNIVRQKIDNKLAHLYMISVIVDGNQSTKFAADSNIQALELDQDSNGQNAFYRYGINGSNLSVTEFFEPFRHELGQDLDEGVIPWVPGPYKNGLNPDNLEGGSYLNMLPKGWTDTNYAVQVGSVSSTNMTPRVENYLVSLNPAGLVKNNG